MVYAALIRAAVSGEIAADRTAPGQAMDNKARFILAATMSSMMVAMVTLIVTWLNLGQLPASFLLLASADRMVRTMWSYLACGFFCLAAVLAIVFGDGAWVVIGCGVWGCFGATVLILVLALPPLISPPEDVHRVSAGMFVISYSCAVIVPIISGLLWDLTGWTLAPFFPIGVCSWAATAW